MQLAPLRCGETRGNKLLAVVGLYKLNPADPQIESAWFQPLNL
jgi:hypothetical protein